MICIRQFSGDIFVDVAQSSDSSEVTFRFRTKPHLKFWTNRADSGSAVEIVKDVGDLFHQEGELATEGWFIYTIFLLVLKAFWFWHSFLAEILAFNFGYQVHI